MKFRDFLREQKEKSAVLAFGRMNPITNGHEKLVNKVKKVAKEAGASHHIVLSHSQDPKKNPLSAAQKLKHAKNAFPGTNFVAASKNSPTFFDHAEKLHKQGVTDFHMVGGSDRTGEFARLLRKYNGTHEGARFNFKTITVHTAGERDPDAEGVAGISASKMREAAKNGDFDTFRKGAPSKMSQAHVKQMFNDVRKGMNLKEEVITEGVHDKGIFKAVFLGGGPGSGKDYVLSNTLDGHGLTEINSDKALEYLMDKEDLDMKMPENEEEQRNAVRKRAKNITELRQRLALHGRNGLIINGTGDDPEKYKKIKEKLEALGYETKMVMVNTADEVSRQRNVERGQRGGRTVPEDIRKEKWDAVQASRVEHAKIFGDNYVEFDNSEDLRSAPPEVVDAKNKEMQGIFKDIQKFVGAAPKNDQSKQWIANELGKKDTAPVVKDARPHADAGHQEEGNKLGLEYYGFGRYGKDGKVTHRSVHGKLVEIQPKQKETPDLPVMGSGSASTKEFQLRGKQKEKLKDIQSKSKLPKTKNESINDKFENFLSEAVTVTITGDTAEEVSKTFRLLRTDDEEMTEQEEVNTMSDPGAYNLLRLGMPLIKEDLRNWFDPKHPEGGWKRINSKGEAIGPCAREPGEAKPKCMSNEKRASLSKKERASAVAAKRKHDPNPERKGEPINVSSFGKGKISEETEKKQKLLADKNGKPRTFLLRASAAKEAHTKNGTVHKVGSKYVVKIKEDKDEVYSPTHNAIEAAYGQNSSTPSAKQLGKVRTDSGRTEKPRLDKPVAEERRTISLSSIKENFQKKIQESIDKGIEPGISMAAAGESPARDMGEKLSKKGKATQVVPKNISELTGDETTASIGDQKEDELKKKGISITTFKKRNYI
jgi:predicted kinase